MAIADFCLRMYFLTLFVDLPVPPETPKQLVGALTNLFVYFSRKLSGHSLWPKTNNSLSPNVTGKISVIFDVFNPREEYCYLATMYSYLYVIYFSTFDTHDVFSYSTSDNSYMYPLKQNSC
jgi:hypothetical protein